MLFSRLTKPLLRSKFAAPQMPRMQFGGMSGLGVNESKQEGQSDKLELWQMDDRMAVLLTLEDKPGILNKALSILTHNGINMTAIQSRP